jgi:diacylglycerol kinase family enzyme
VAGGGGSGHGALTALHQAGERGGTAIGLIPLGTGNDFARSAGIPPDPADAARLVLDGRLGPVDLVTDDAGGVVVNNVHAGLGADAARRGARWKQRLGRAGYVVGALPVAFRKAYRLRVEVDTTVVADDRAVLEVSIGNGATVGGGLPLNPRADPRDGVLDVMVSFAAGPVARVGYAADLVRASHTRRGDVWYGQAESVLVEGRPFWCSADGELTGPVPRRRWTVQPGAFRMTLPPQSQA